MLARWRPRRRREVTARLSLVRVGRLLRILLAAVIAIILVKRRASVLRLLTVGRWALVGALVVALLLAVTVHLVAGVVVVADAEFTTCRRHPAGSVEWFVTLATTATSDASAVAGDC